MVEREGLREKVNGALLHRLDSEFHSPKGGHDDHGRCRVGLPECLQQSHSVHGGKPQVSEDDGRTVGHGKTLFCAGSRFDLISLGFKVQRQNTPELFLVFDDQDSRLHVALV
jgi:hypothetical protein